MRISEQEQRAMKRAIDIGSQYGFGNVIAHLKTAWAKSLVESGLDKKTSLEAADASPYPLEMHTDIIEGGFWDETGRRYSDNRPFYRCDICGQRFRCSGPPAHTDPSNPQCASCIDKMLDAIDAPPMTDEQVNRVMRKAGF